MSVPKSPDARGKGADWQDPWPVRGIAPGEPKPSAGVDGLRAEGYVTVFDVAPVPEDADEYQDHLNNTAAVRMYNDLRVAYVAACFAPDWPRFVRRQGMTLVVRELHVAYDSEGWMHEQYVGATRVAQRRGKALILEQRLVEASSARSLSRAWVLQLLIGADGKVIEFPDLYFELAEKAQGAPVPQVAASRAEWGPSA
jgi:acyl-CoA thioesterase FadM